MQRQPFGLCRSVHQCRPKQARTTCLLAVAARPVTSSAVAEGGAGPRRSSKPASALDPATHAQPRAMVPFRSGPVRRPSDISIGEK